MGCSQQDSGADWVHQLIKYASGAVAAVAPLVVHHIWSGAGFRQQPARTALRRLRPTRHRRQIRHRHPE